MSSGKFRLFPPNSVFLPAISAFFFRLSWLDFRFPCCLTPEIQGCNLWLQGFLFSKLMNMQKIMPAKVLELNTFSNLVLAFFQQPEPNSASRAVFGSTS